MMIEETLTIIRTYNAQTLKNFVVLCVVSSQVCISAISYPHSVDNGLYVVPDNIRSIDETSKRRKEFPYNDFSSNNSDRLNMKPAATYFNNISNNNKKDKDKEDEGGCNVF